MSLFNGVDLTGWTGGPDAYSVENGLLVSKETGGPPLFTKEEYRDFVLRFEFKLTPGANNGLLIRAPSDFKAFQAMEIHILDDRHPKYANLPGDEYHGCLWKVAHATRGHLKPVGEWNSQEVTARGSDITVKLNGVAILNVDLKKLDLSKIDAKHHPAFQREQGHLGFLPTEGRVEFRNILIKSEGPRPMLEAPSAARLPPGFENAFMLPDADKDQHCNPVVERNGSRVDPATGWPYEIWLKEPRMEFVLIPPGEFLMGSTEDEIKRLCALQKSEQFKNEGPQHRLRITKPFYLAKYEITQAQ